DCASSSIIRISITFNGGLRSEIRATGEAALTLSEAKLVAVGAVKVFSVPQHLRGDPIHRYRLIADFRTSPMVASGSRAPVFSAIHFFSFWMMSSSSFLSAADGT